MKIINKKGDLKNSIVGVLAFIFIVAVLVFIFIGFNYYNSSGFALGFGAEIESVKISDDGNFVFVRLKGGSVDKELESVRFVLTDNEGNKYFFETFEGLSDLEVPYRKSFFGGIFGREELEGFFDYEIFVGEIEGLGSFNGLKDISVVFNYVEEGTEKSSNILSVKVIPSGDVKNESVSSGSGTVGSWNTGRTGGTNVGDTNIVDGEGDGDEDEEPPIPVCIPNMQITANCLCYSEEKSSGYCCSAQWQEGGCQIFEATYYVDGNLDDDCDDYNVSIRSCGSGNKRAFNTIQKGVNVLVAGDTLAVREGVYRESVTIKSSGNKTHRITIRNYPGEQPVIDGSEIIGGWIKCSSQEECLGNENWETIYYGEIEIPNYLETHAPLYLNLFQDDEPLAFSQTPSTNNNWGPDLNYFYEGVDSISLNTLSDSRLQELGGSLLNGSRIYIWVVPNIVYKGRIINSLDSEITFSPTMSGGVEPYSNVKTKYAIIHSPLSSIFNSKGEYYLNESVNSNGKNLIYIWPLKDPTNSEITYSVRQSGITLTDKDYLTIEGFKIQKQNGDSYCEGTAISTGKATNGDGCIDLIIRNNEITRTRGDCQTAILYGNVNLIFENNYFHDLAGTSRVLVALSENITIRNNLFERTVGTVIYFPGAVNSSIINNTIINSSGVHGNSITVYQGSKNILIADNYVENSAPATFQRSSNILLYNNIFLEGFACWDNGDNLYFFNNLFDKYYLLPSSCFLNVSKNNLFHNAYYSLNTDYSNEIIMGNRAEIFENSFVARVNLPYETMFSQGIGTNTDTIYFERRYHDVVKPGQFMLFSDNVPREILSVDEVVWIGNWRTRVILNSTIPNIESVGYVWEDYSNQEIDLCHKSEGIAVDAGADISSYVRSTGFEELFPNYDFYKDKAGNPRPIGEWDIGPYEYRGEFETTSTISGKAIFEQQKRFKLIEWIKELFK